jgi:hypothetical protein
MNTEQGWVMAHACLYIASHDPTNPPRSSVLSPPSPSPCPSSTTSSERHNYCHHNYYHRAVSWPLGAVPEGLGGMAELRRLLPGGPGGAKPLLHTRLF